MAKALTIHSTLKMNSGWEIPVLGYGVYQTPADVTEDVTLHAFKVGYRHVDSAVMYRNEEPCGAAIKKSGLPREQIFFTSKVPVKEMSYEGASKCVDETLEKTGLGYIDLYLLHSPYGGKEGRAGAWRALVDAVEAGKVRSIGVSNYGVHHLDELEAYIKELEKERGKGKGGVISVGQWELHPWLARPDIVDWCFKRGVVVQAYCPVVRAQKMDDPTVQKLANKYSVTPAQVLMRWSLQKGFVPLPKSQTYSRIEENANVYHFQLSEEDMESLNTGDYSPIAWDPTVSKE